MTITAKIASHAKPGVEITPETELAECLCEMDRIGALPFWIEDLTGSYGPTDAELMRWSTAGDVERWVQGRVG